MKTNAGADLQALGTSSPSGDSGTATATSSTSLTDSGKTWATTSGANIGGVAGVWAGKIVIAGTVWGTILSNTATVLTVDSWKTLSTSGAIATGSTPGNVAYQILPGGSPALYIALTTDSAVASASDTTLASEQNSNGLSRALATYAHTSGTSTYTLSKTFTYTGSGAVAIAKVGVFNASSGGVMMFESVLGTAATVAANGDTIAVTETITLS